MINRLTGQLDFQAQALALRSERQRVIASNIANADTPGYVARDFDFSQALRDATATLPRPPAPGAAGASATNDLGSPVAGPLLDAGFGRLRPTTDLRYATPAQTNLDSNTVDMDRERAAFADNALKYETSLRFINGSVKTLTDAMKSHNQG
ncbi:flagellar basal body rod protein FlgB [Rubrivivax gelatinosus]|uniref:Flagellar basal body rod protein FlgB n=1 Tax=Rubrivivax gelatinosus TaxID=28068 RepID=A0A4R2M377_RUBGE|nr:flagellar basal body protein [Rubrivivax gelatinosus]MBK1689906.1 flagellar basal body rod protein FlgB [Rubrivivax gelatinosus]TCP01589.1 flagellar basal-body rod protein FlgB [Rubrivivax gelatinosus]